MKSALFGAAVACALLVVGSAKAAVVTYDFEDGIVGSSYQPPHDQYVAGFSSNSTIVEDALGKHLAIGPADQYHQTDFYIYSTGETFDGPHAFLASLNIVSLDVFIPLGGTLSLPYGTSHLPIPAGQWTTVHTGQCVGLYSSYCHLYTQGLGVLLDNIVVNESFDALPEPATWALMIGGLGFAGAKLRSRSSRTRVAC